MKSNVTDLEKALLGGVVACDLGMPIAQENALFDKPANGAPWAATFIAYNPPFAKTLGEGGEDEHTGFIQIDLNFPLLGGTADTIAACQKVASYLKAGRVLTHGVTDAIVSSVARSYSRPVEGWYRTTLTIAWYARIAR